MLFTLNIRGLGDNTKRTGVRVFCPIQNIKIVCLQETMLDSMDDSILKSLGVLHSKLGGGKSSWLLQWHF